MDPDLIQRVGPYVSTRSSFYRIFASASRAEQTERVEALVFRDLSGTVQVLEWLF